MIKKIILLLLIPVSANAHESSLSHFQGGFLSEVLHVISNAHHAYGGLVIAVFALCAFKLFKHYRQKKQRAESLLKK